MDGPALLRLIGHIPWLRLGLRRRAVLALYPPETVAPRPFTTPFRGGTYRGNVANALEWHVFFFGGYELKELDLIDDMLRAVPGAVAVDIGANLGNHSLSMSRYASAVHAFEPYHAVADRIEEQLALNANRKVTVHRVALGEEADEQPYFLDVTARNQGTGSFLASHTGSQQAAMLQIVRGDDYLADKLDRLDFIKIDIEGFEAPALTGLHATLAAHEPVIMMEVTRSSTDMFDARGGLDAVLPFAFDLWRVANPAYPLGILQTARYKLSRIDSLRAEGASFNVLIVPHSRRASLAGIVPSR